jgi:hypothetical protein
MSKRNCSKDAVPPQPSANDRDGHTRRRAAPPPEDARAARLIQKAVAQPGSAAVPERKIETAAPAVRSVPPRQLGEGGGDEGTFLTPDPATMTVTIDRPNPHSWVRFNTAHVLDTALLAYRERRDGAAEYYFVVSELEPAVLGSLKQVKVALVFDTAAQGDCFLWIVPATPFSPYFCAMAFILAQGGEALGAGEYLVQAPVKRSQGCKVKHRLNDPDSPLTVWPSRPLGVLLYEALSPDHVIADPSHPIYRRLTTGRTLT